SNMLYFLSLRIISKVTLVYAGNSALIVGVGVNVLSGVVVNVGTSGVTSIELEAQAETSKVPIKPNNNVNFFCKIPSHELVIAKPPNGLRHRPRRGYLRWGRDGEAVQ